MTFAHPSTLVPALPDLVDQLKSLPYPWVVAIRQSGRTSNLDTTHELERSRLGFRPWISR